MNILNKQVGELVGVEKHPESALDSLGLGYKVLEDIDWEDDGKYQLGVLIVEIKGQIFGISVSRSGSYFSDYYYNIDGVEELKRYKTYTVKSEESFVSLSYTQDTSGVIQKARDLLKELTNE